MNLSRMIALAAYDGFARYLPASDSRRTRWTRPIRAAGCRHIFKHAGKHINIEKGAYFGAAAAVVTENVPPLAIVAGNPARVIRYRNEQKL